ncbi:hypothetical protein D3C72_1785340 [compost metagenome]
MLGVQHGLCLPRHVTRIHQRRAVAIDHQHPIRGAVVQAGKAFLQAALPGDAGQPFARHQGSRVRRTGQRAGQQHLFGQRQGQLQPARRVRDRQGECQVQAQAAVSFVRQHAAQTGLRQHGGHLMRIVARQRISDGRVGGLRKLFGPQFFAAHVKSLGSCMTRCAITSSCTSVVPA